MKVSVVTPNFNGKEFLKDYFDSLNLNKSHIGEVIIIDNNSTDGSVEFIKNYPKDFEFKLIENKKNLGFAKATNQGIELSKYSYIFTLNNDVKFGENTIEELLKIINRNDNIFSVASKMIQMDNPDLIDDAGDEYTLLAYTKKRGDNKPIESYNEVSEVFSSCAGAALYKKSVLDEIGLFDESFFAYMEDVDLGYRAKISGYKNLYSPKAIVYHKGSGASGSRYNDFKIKLAARNNIWVVYKNLPVIQKILNIGFLILGFAIKYLFFKRKGYGDIYLNGLKEGLNNKNKVKKVKFQSKNTKNYIKIEWELIKNTFKLLK